MSRFHIHPDISEAETLPATFYRSQEVFDALREGVFMRTWQWLGNASHLIPLPGSVYPLMLLDNFLAEPVVLVRNQDDEISCLCNVCTHRGNLVVQHPGQVRQLVCGYHGRQFHLNGKFKRMPEFGEAKNFPRPCDNLHQFPVREWAGHLFVGLEPDFDLREVLTVLEERIGFLPLSEFQLDQSLCKDYLVNGHWALYCDNYLEGFHIPFVHNDLNQALDCGQYETVLYDHASLQIGYSGGGEEVFDLPPGHPDYGKRVAAYYYWIFPNMMFNFYPWGLSVNVVKPLSLHKTKVSFITYVYDEAKLGAGAGALLDKVEREDEFVVESVHRGLRSRYYRAGRFSPTRERGVHQFHRLLAEYLHQS